MNLDTGTLLIAYYSTLVYGIFVSQRDFIFIIVRCDQLNDTY